MKMIFCVVLIITAVCIAALVCYVVSGKVLQEKIKERDTKKAVLAKKSKRWHEKDEFNNKGAYETLVLTEEEHRQFDEAENEIDELTDKIRQLEEIHSVTYRAIFVCSVLFVASLLVFTVAGLVQT